MKGRQSRRTQAGALALKKQRHEKRKLENANAARMEETRKQHEADQLLIEEEKKKAEASATKVVEDAELSSKPIDNEVDNVVDNDISHRVSQVNESGSLNSMMSKLNMSPNGGSLLNESEFSGGASFTEVVEEADRQEILSKEQEKQNSGRAIARSLVDVGHGFAELLVPELNAVANDNDIEFDIEPYSSTQRRESFENTDLKEYETEEEDDGEKEDEEECIEIIPKLTITDNDLTDETDKEKQSQPLQTDDEETQNAIKESLRDQQLNAGGEEAQLNAALEISRQQAQPKASISFNEIDDDLTRNPFLRFLWQVRSFTNAMSDINKGFKDCKEIEAKLDKIENPSDYMNEAKELTKLFRGYLDVLPDELARSLFVSG